MRLFSRRRDEEAPAVEEPAEIAAPLTAAQEEVLETLRREGIVVLPFEQLVPEPGLWDSLAQDIDAWSADAQSRVRRNLTTPTEKDDFLIRRYRAGKAAADAPSKHARFTPDNPWLRLAVSSGVLDIVNRYRGQATKLVDLDHWYTVPFGADYSRVQSQRWHRDPEDRHVVKMFTYFSDVDQGAGPFQYVRGSAEGGRYGDLWPWGEADWYPPQDEFEAKIPADEHMTVEGPRGTVILCDTSGFHRGGFAEKTPRILSFHTFVSPQSDQRRKFSVDWSGDVEVSDQARYALA